VILTTQKSEQAEHVLDTLFQTPERKPEMDASDFPDRNLREQLHRQSQRASESALRRSDEEALSDARLKGKENAEVVEFVLHS